MLILRPTMNKETEEDGEALPPLLPPISCRAIPGARCSCPQNSVTYTVRNEHSESASLLILSCWLSAAVVAEPQCTAGTPWVGSVRGGECLCPRCSRAERALLKCRCREEAQKMGSVVKSWETTPEPRASKPHFPQDAAVAGGFIFWQKCFCLYSDGRSVNSFLCALITCLPASCYSHVKNSQIPSPACLWPALTRVTSCAEPRRGQSDGFVSNRESSASHFSLLGQVLCAVGVILLVPFGSRQQQSSK